MNKFTNVLLLSAVITHGACGMGYFFGNGKKNTNGEIAQVKKIIFAVHELNTHELMDNLSREEFVELFNKLSDKEKICRAQRGAIFSNPETGYLYRSLLQLNEKDLQAVCQKLEIPTYWAR